MSFKMYVPFNPDFAFTFYRTNVRSDRSLGLHFHDCLEINYCLRGKGYLLIDDKRLDFEPGEFYFINNLEVHEAVSTDRLQMIVIMFDPSIVYQDAAMDFDYLRPFFAKDRVYYSNKLEVSPDMRDMLRDLIFDMEQELEEKQQGYQMMIKAILMRFLGLVYRNLQIRSVDSQKQDFAAQYERLRPALSYINTHYTRSRLTLDELAEQVYMNRTYFSTFFKRVMRVSVFDYINNLKIQRAKMLLRGGDMSILSISGECGFDNVTYFNKRFKASTGLSPGEYRRRTANAPSDTAIQET